MDQSSHDVDYRPPFSIRQAQLAGGRQCLRHVSRGEPRDEGAAATSIPVSTWDDCDEALTAAAEAFEQMRKLPASKIAAFLEAFAGRIEARKDEIVRAGQSGDGAARFAAAGRQRAAADDEPTSPGGRGGPRGLVGAADDRHEEQHPLDATGRSARSSSSGRTIFRSRSTAPAAAILPRPSRPAIR